MANIVCPHCHEELEMDGEMAVGEKLVCPCCGKAFVCSRKKTKNPVNLSNGDMSSKGGVGIGRWLGFVVELLCGIALWIGWARALDSSSHDEVLDSILTLLYFMSAVAFTKWCIHLPKK